MNAGSTVALLGAEENLLAEFRKGSPLAVACGALVERLVQPDTSLFWNFLVGVYTFLVSPACGAQQDCQKRQELGKDAAFFTPQLPVDGEYIPSMKLYANPFYFRWYL